MSGATQRRGLSLYQSKKLNIQVGVRIELTNCSLTNKHCDLIWPLEIFKYICYFLIQIVGNKPKDGNKTAKDTEPKSLKLHYLNASNSGEPHEDDKYFIMDIEEFKKNLPIIKVPKVELPQS